MPVARAMAWAALLGAPTAAFAEQPPSPVAPPAPKQPAADPAAVAAADRLVAVAGLAAQFDTMIPKIIDLMMPAVVPGNTGREAELRKILSEEFVTSFSRTKALLVTEARDLYAARFSASELNAIADFYSTPVGKKSLVVGADIQVEMFALGQEAGRAAAQDAMPRILERLRRANFKLPQGV